MIFIDRENLEPTVIALFNKYKDKFNTFPLK